MDGTVDILVNSGIPLGIIRDISEGGFSVGTSTPYKVGDEMLLSVKPSLPVDPIQALAEVVWVSPLEASFHPTGMGLKFLELSEEDFYKLETVLELA
jgi:Tfp pilus assembly protein PilZ